MIEHICIALLLITYHLILSNVQKITCAAFDKVCYHKGVPIKSCTSYFCILLNNASRASPTPKGVIYGNSKIIIHEHLWLIDGHF